jgi:AP-1 complex subunit sigma 1/2
MIHMLIIFNRQGQLRLSKYYSPYSQKERGRIQKESISAVLHRKPRECNFLDYRDLKLVYRRYASLFFAVLCDTDDNELLTLEVMHRYVTALDMYFGNVCELDIIFNFDKAYQLLDELLCTGEIQETSTKTMLRAVTMGDDLVMQEVMGTD